ncbi:MAG: DDE-type integrase/transposase/recombinase [Thermoprotei archaeon]|jgi:transposase InsO family protein
MVILPSVIRKSFPPLMRRISRLVKSSILGDFWKSVLKKNERAMLNDGQVRWIIKSKEEGCRSSDIARLQDISERRVRQIYSYYRKVGEIPQFKKPGRMRRDITEEERNVIRRLHGIYKTNACYLEQILSAHGYKINHNRIHRILVQEGLALIEEGKHVRKKWIRYEREYSNSLWHADWHRIKDDRWKDGWLICYEDDASRFITGYGIAEEPSSKMSVEILDSAIAKYGKPASIITDHGTTFYTVESEKREKGLTEFESYLLKNKIRFIVGRVRHPQSNGKIEKFFDIFEKKIRYFSSIDEFFYWYNCVRPHGAFDLSKIETPIKMFYARMPQSEMLMDPSILERGEEINCG